MKKQTNIQTQVKNWERDNAKLIAALQKIGNSEISEKQSKKFQSDYNSLLQRGEELNQKLTISAN